MSSTSDISDSLFAFPATKEIKFFSNTAPLLGGHLIFRNSSDAFLFEKNEALIEFELNENITPEPLLFTHAGFVHRGYNRKSKELLETIPPFELV